MVLRLTLLGVGAMNSPRYAPAGLLLRYVRRRVAFDGGPGAEPPKRLDRWLVTDLQAELASSLRWLAADRGVQLDVADLRADELPIEAHEVAHTSHPTYGCRIEAAGLIAVWAPEFWETAAWAANATVMFPDAAGWNRPIRFRGGVGGHASVRDIEVAARRHHVRRLVYAHIGRPCLRAMDAGHEPAVGEWGVEGRTYTLRATYRVRRTGKASGRCPDTRRART